jgi:hypothetical protein
MFGTRARSIVTATVVGEAAIAGWVLGYGALGLLLMVLAVTAADTAWGMLRRRSAADLAGLEMAAVLATLLVARADVTMAALVAAACVAWLIRPERQEPFERLTRPAARPSAS